MTYSATASHSAAPPQGSGRFLATFIACVVVILAVIVFGLLIAKNAANTAAETNVLAQISRSRVSSVVDISLALDKVFSPTFAIVIGIVAAGLVFLASRKWMTVIHFVLLMAGTWLGSEVVKLIVRRPRPTARLADTLVPNPDPDSYPSGHVCFAVGLGFALFVVIANARLTVIVGILAVILSVGTAWTRVYLGIHYPSDAIASLVYSAAAFVAIEALWRQFSGRIFRMARRSATA